MMSIGPTAPTILSSSTATKAGPTPPPAMRL